MSVDFTMIDSNDDLAGLVARLSEVDVISIDTEFARFNTYYPIVGLIQIYDGSECFLCDHSKSTHNGRRYDCWGRARY